MRFVKARARAIVEDAMIRMCQSKLEKIGKCRLPRMSLWSWDPGILRCSVHPASPVGSHLVAIWRGPLLMTIPLFDRGGAGVQNVAFRECL